MARILIADVSTRGAAQLARSLQSKGHHVRVATECNQAICMIRHARLDLVVLDVTALGACGMPLLEAVQQTLRDPQGPHGVIYHPAVDDSDAGDPRELWGLAVVNAATDPEQASRRIEACVAQEPLRLRSAPREPMRLERLTA